VLYYYLGWALNVSDAPAQPAAPPRPKANQEPADAGAGPAGSLRGAEAKPAPVATPKPAFSAAAAGGSATQLEFWVNVAKELAKLPAADVLTVLAGQDPFGVRTFEQQLVTAETEKGRTLQPGELQELFGCPADAARVTLPDLRDHQTAAAFREGTPDSWLFFQHLRKAGGTGFCTLAEKNMARKEVPRYYCMPDMGWEGGWQQHQAGFLSHWSNEEITRRMREKGHRIAGNEWDRFAQRHFDLPGAIFATSFRKPLDRALSQFRFECAEHRGCRHEVPETWWPVRQDLWNVYTLTFADEAPRKVYWTKPDMAQKRANMMETAVRTLSRYNLVLAMEWLAYAGPQVTSVLGFEDTTTLTKRVRPHINQAQREGGNSVEGAASVRDHAWRPEDKLDPALFKTMSESLAMDEILTDVARRMFLERLACEGS